MLKLGLLGRHLAFLRNQTQPSDQGRVWLQLGSDADVIHPQQQPTLVPAPSKLQMSPQGVGDEVRDGTEGEQVSMASSAVKLLCRHSGLNEGCEVTEREPMWIYAILSYGPGSHLLLTGVGVEGLTDL